ncbi:MAG: hypothetical protein CM15mV109_120 [uncultured marine virus]|nr:MAG: hypothetical protein CM15mV109_120 [uncultured marine virus]
MSINKIHQFEKSIVALLNLGWVESLSIVVMDMNTLTQ